MVGWTYGCIFRHAEVAEYLISQGADINARTTYEFQWYR